MEFKMITALLRFSAICILSPAFTCVAAAQAPVNRKPAETGNIAQTAILRPSPSASDDRYRIGYQDTLEIQIFRHPDLTQRVNVNANGTINLFRLPEPLVAVCKTEEELANDVAEAYKKDYLRNPEVKVIAAEQRSRAFAVIGAVEKPGSYLIGRKISLLELLAQAGGPSKEAGTRMLVARTGSTSNCKMNEVSASNDNVSLMDFKIKDVLEGKSGLFMLPGDIVSVLKFDIVYVYGNVNKQGQIPIKEPITLTQAIASAEGLKPSTKRDKVRILRQRANSSERDELVFNLDDIDKRKVQDPFLEPNDVVAVSEDAMKNIMRNVVKTVTGGIPSLLYKVPL